MKSPKKTTTQHKKNRKDARVLVGLPKPQNVADAWDAMQVAGELPPQYDGVKTNPFRAEQDKVDTLKGFLKPGSHQTFPSHELAFDPKRRMSPSNESVLTTWSTPEPKCSHRRADSGRLSIAWMMHSQYIVKGVCYHCFFPFDTRNPAHLKLWEEDIVGSRFAGQAAQSFPPSPLPRGAVYGTETQIFMYNWFPWVYRVQVWLRKKYREIRAELENHAFRD